MPNRRRRGDQFSIVVTNAATFSESARATIRSETSRLIALRRIDQRRALERASAAARPRTGSSIREKQSPAEDFSSIPTSTSRKLADGDRAAVLSSQSGNPEFLSTARKRLRLAVISNNQPKVQHGSQRDTKGHANPIPRAISGIIGTEFHISSEAVSLLNTYRARLFPRQKYNPRVVILAADHIFPRVLQDQVLFSSIMYAAVTLVSGTTDGVQSVERFKSTNEGLLEGNQSSPATYRSQAIQLLRERLAKGGIEHSLAEILEAILHLVLPEIQYGTAEDVSAHVDGIYQMLRYTNVASVAPLSMLIGAINLLCLGAAITKKLPPFPTIVPATAISAEMMKAVDPLNPMLPKTATGFFRPTISALLGDKIMELIQRRRLWFNVRDLTVSGHINHQGGMQEYAYFYIASRRVDYELLELLIHHPETLTPLQICVAEALFLSGFINGIISFEPYYMYSQILSRRYYHSFTHDEKGLPSFWRPDVKLGPLPSEEREQTFLMTWLFFIGCHFSCDQIERLWFMNQLSKALQILGVQNETRFEELLATFFCFQQVFEQSVKDIWKEVSKISMGSGFS